MSNIKPSMEQIQDESEQLTNLLQLSDKILHNQPLTLVCSFAMSILVQGIDQLDEETRIEMTSNAIRVLQENLKEQLN